MIQRIQTLYLLMVLVCAVVGLCTSVGGFYSEGLPVGEMGNLRICWGEEQTDYSVWALFPILLLVAISSFLAIFLFRFRMRQVRLCIFAGLLLVGYYIAFGVFVYMTTAKWDVDFTVSWTAALPAVALVLDYLAFRAIMKDELMVRSLDRLR